MEILLNGFLWAYQVTPTFWKTITSIWCLRWKGFWGSGCSNLVHFQYGSFYNANPNLGSHQSRLQYVSISSNLILFVSLKGGACDSHSTCVGFLRGQAYSPILQRTELYPIPQGCCVQPHPVVSTDQSGRQLFLFFNWLNGGLLNLTVSLWGLRLGQRFFDSFPSRR